MKNFNQVTLYNLRFLKELTMIKSKKIFDQIFFQPTERPSINAIQEKLVQLSMTPTWTNVAYQKYYGPPMKY